MTIQCLTGAELQQARRAVAQARGPDVASRLENFRVADETKTSCPSCKQVQVIVVAAVFPGSTGDEEIRVNLCRACSYAKVRK